MTYHTPHIKSCFSKILRVIWPGEQFKVGPFILKHPVYPNYILRKLLQFVLMSVIALLVLKR